MAPIQIPVRTHAAKWGKLTFVAAVIFLTGSPALGLQCYQCTITPPSIFANQTARLCVNFDYSEKYIVDCPFSTMCMKQAFEFMLANKERVHGVLRDCAAQKHDYQAYKDGKWHLESDIKEPYQEGCWMQDDKGARSLPTEYCYCRGHLCNSAPSTHKGGDLNYHTDAMAVIMVFNAMKYIRSMR